MTLEEKIKLIRFGKRKIKVRADVGMFVKTTVDSACELVRVHEKELEFDHTREGFIFLHKKIT